MTGPSAPATKAARQARIAAILAMEQVHSQEQLAGLLDRYAGMHVAQATLSRDLDELGVVRLRAGDGSLVYALPGEPGGPGARPGTGLDYPERTRPAPDARPSPQAAVARPRSYK
jgi:transcriptional regulator of arginine metabolism